MARDVQILLLFLATLAGIGVYVVFVREDPTQRPALTVSSDPGTAPVPEPTEMGTTVTPGGQCVELRFLDEKDVVIPVNPPLIGIMIGDGPLFEGSPPTAAKIEPGRFVPCPEALVASTRKTFEDFCTSDERRKKAAANNGADLALINKRCGDMSAALAK